MALDQSLIALLTGAGGFKSGNPNMLPSFTGGRGLDQNLLALLMSQGMLPRRIGMDGSYMMPNAGGETSGFHSGSALDAFQSEGSMASRSMYAGRMGAERPTHPSMLTNDSAEIAAAQMAFDQQQANQKLQPTQAEIDQMSLIRKQLPPAWQGPPMPKLGRKVRTSPI